MTPFSSFCATMNQRQLSALQSKNSEQSAYIVKSDVRDFTQSLAFLSHVLLQVEEQGRVVFEFLERKHALEDDDAAVFARLGHRRSSRTLIFGGPVFEFSEKGVARRTRQFCKRGTRSDPELTAEALLLACPVSPCPGSRLRVRHSESRSDQLEPPNRRPISCCCCCCPIGRP